MISFAVVLFFAATGLTLNHPDWFAGREQTIHKAGFIPTTLLREGNVVHPDKLAIVELIRTAGKITKPVTEFRSDESQIYVSFRGPGYTADAFVDSSTGSYDLTETKSGLLAVVNDLHRGQNTGKLWSAIIDASAIFLIAVSLTGLILILFLKRRRTSGLVLSLFGAVLCTLAYWLLVP